jgi:hypothetical protein
MVSRYAPRPVARQQKRVEMASLFVPTMTRK